MYRDGKIMKAKGMEVGCKRRDISEQNSTTKNFSGMVCFENCYDNLTGLYSRNMLDSRINALIVSHRVNGDISAVYFIDIDDFRDVNNTLGHEAGDEFLIVIAKRLKEVCSDLDGDIFRFGGDAFVVLVRKLGVDPIRAKIHADAIASQMQFSLNQNVCILTPAATTLPSKCSIGILMVDDASFDVSQVKMYADIAMHKAKYSGKNSSVIFETAFRDEIREKVETQKALDEALANENFEIWFQPQYEKNETYRMVGAEVLIRWRRNDGSITYPAHFIQVAEGTGQIVRIGEWVLEQTIKTLASWRSMPHMAHLTLSVNVSPLQMRCFDFISLLTKMLREYGVDPKKLKLEVTESVSMQDFEGTAVRVMEAAMNMGVEVSIDDFGTGYSSISYLKRMPVNQIKIDKIFVDDISTCGVDKQIVASMAAISKELGIGIIAEGIEDAQQLEALEAIGVCQFQGYLFARPMPIDHFEKRCQFPDLNFSS